MNRCVLTGVPWHGCNDGAVNHHVLSSPEHVVSANWCRCSDWLRGCVLATIQKKVGCCMTQLNGKASARTKNRMQAKAQYSPVREIYLDWLEPIFVIRSDSHKRVPNQQRQLLRTIAWSVTWLQNFAVCSSDREKSETWVRIIRMLPHELRSIAYWTLEGQLVSVSVLIDLN